MKDARGLGRPCGSTSYPSIFPMGVLQNLALYPLLFLLSGAPPVWVWWIVAQQAHVGSCVSTSLCLQLSERAGRGESRERLENHVQTSPCNSPQRPLPGRQWEPCPRIFILSVSSPLKSQGWVGRWESCSPTGLEAMMGPLLLCLLFWCSCSGGQGRVRAHVGQGWGWRVLYLAACLVSPTHSARESGFRKVGGGCGHLNSWMTTGFPPLSIVVGSLDMCLSFACPALGKRVKNVGAERRGGKRRSGFNI